LRDGLVRILENQARVENASVAAFAGRVRQIRLAHELIMAAPVGSACLRSCLTHAKAELTRAQISSVLHSLLFVIFGEAIGEYRAAVAPVRSDEAQ